VGAGPLNLQEWSRPNTHVCTAGTAGEGREEWIRTGWEQGWRWQSHPSEASAGRQVAVWSNT